MDDLAYRTARSELAHMVRQICLQRGKGEEEEAERLSQEELPDKILALREVMEAGDSFSEKALQEMFLEEERRVEDILTLHELLRDTVLDHLEQLIDDKLEQITDIVRQQGGSGAGGRSSGTRKSAATRSTSRGRSSSAKTGGASSKESGRAGPLDITSMIDAALDEAREGDQ